MRQNHAYDKHFFLQELDESVHDLFTQLMLCRGEAEDLLLPKRVERLAQRTI